MARAKRPGGERAAGGARHLAVDVAVPQVVDDAAGGAHHQTADGEQDDQADGLGGGGADQQDAPQPGQKQQPGADRPIDAGEQQVRQPRAWQTGDPTGGGDVGVHGQKVCSPFRGSVKTPYGFGMIRLHVDAGLEAGASVEGTEGQAHYLGGVMRRSVGDPVHLFNGRDGEWICRIAVMSRGKVAFGVETLVRPQAPDADLWLAFAVLKRDTTDLVVQKATELGVSALLPVFTERTNAGRVNLDRLRAIAIEAAEQSERLTVPEVRPARQLHDVLRGVAGGTDACSWRWSGRMRIRCGALRGRRGC